MDALPPCPNKPNCISTMETAEVHAVEAIPFIGSVEDAKAKIKKASDSIGRNTLIKETPNSLVYEFKSLIFRFVDDVEFRFDDTTKKIHFRSASRIGHSDWGANRKRMSQIRTKYEELR